MAAIPADLDAENEEELSDRDYLLDLSDRIFKIPAMYGVDGYDYDRLRSIVKEKF